MRIFRLLCFASLLMAFLATGCKKKVDDMEFSGTVIGYRECSGYGMSISDMDWGWVVALDQPEKLGTSYTCAEGTFQNVVLLYGTHTRFDEGAKLKGRLYLDDKYATSYCITRYNDLPQAVCSSLD